MAAFSIIQDRKKLSRQPADYTSRHLFRFLLADRGPLLEGLYLWFIGVHPNAQNNGVGQKLMTELVDESERMERPIYLETSTMKNIPWYKKFGLDVYNQLDFGYNLFLIRNDR
jgi:ribosomal protein S18 acetylase RimI-like enzyme